MHGNMELMVVQKLVLVEWHILQQWHLNEKNSDLSEIAVVSALGDRQDQGERKSFTGKNFEISNTAKELGSSRDRFRFIISWKRN